jgi:hypothetical protein
MDTVKYDSRREASRAAAYPRTHTTSGRRIYRGRKKACIQAGLSQETIDILHPPGSEPGVKLRK